MSLAWPTRASAGWVDRNLYATRVYKFSMFMEAGVTHVFRTNATSGDTVIHIWDPTAGWEAGYDDDGLGLGVNSRLEFTPSYSRTYHIIVRAYSSWSYGVATLRHCAYVVDSTPCRERTPVQSEPASPWNWWWVGDVPFKGTWVPSPVTYNSPPGYDYQTAQVNTALGGTDDTLLLGLGWNGHLVAFDDDSGVGYMDRLSSYMPSAGITSMMWNLVVGAYANEGYTNVYTNDAPVEDGDGDGLGKMLEYTLQSCDVPDVGDPWSRTHCYGRNLAQLIDSDRDGLFDSEELFGVDDEYAPQPLPAWGANPLHKDIFIEQDWAIRPTCPTTPPSADCWNADVGAQNPFTPAMAASVAQAFQSASAWEAGNIEGTGIALHFDIGPRPPGQECTDPHLCGNWGFGGENRIWGSTDPSWPSWYLPEVRSYTGTPYPYAGEEFGHGARFRYLMIFPGGGSTESPGDLIRVGINGSAPAAQRHAHGVVHELGHSLNISHGGAPSPEEGDPFTSENVNCKPNYASIMNYAFSEASFGFSHGLNPSVLDPGHTAEVDALLGDATHLAAGSTLTKFRFPAATATGSVDFNRSNLTPATDGIHGGTTGFVRAGVTHTTSGGCGTAAHVNHEVLEVEKDTAAAVTPALAIFLGRQWVFWAEGSSIKYRSDTHTGPDGAGSCAGGSGAIGETNCQDFVSKTIRSVPLTTTSTVTGVSVMPWRWTNEGGNPVDSLVLAYSTNLDEVWVRYTTSVSLDDLGWAGAPAGPAITGIVADSEIELTNMFVSTAKGYAQPEVLALFVVMAGMPSVHAWSHANTPAGVWSPPTVVKHQSGADMPGRRVAGLATWPNWPGRIPGMPEPVPTGWACGVFGSPRPNPPAPQPPENRDEGHWGCYPPASEKLSPPPIS